MELRIIENKKYYMFNPEHKQYCRINGKVFFDDIEDILNNYKDTNKTFSFDYNQYDQLINSELIGSFKDMEDFNNTFVEYLI